MGKKKNDSGISRTPEDSPLDAPLDSNACCGIGRRDFVRLAGLTSAIASTQPVSASVAAASPESLGPQASRAFQDNEWPVLKHYDQDHLAHIALPIGGIGTGTVSLCGNGSFRHWEIMNRPSKGFTPSTSGVEPFFALWVRDGEQTLARAIEGPVAAEEYEGGFGSAAPNVNLPRFRNCEFAASYPFGRAMLSDPDVPVDVDLKAFNPMVPGDADASGIPVAVVTFEIRNKTSRGLRISVCGSLPNFVGIDGWQKARDGRGDFRPVGASKNRNRYRSSAAARGILMDSSGVMPESDAWGTITLATLSDGDVSYRTDWTTGRWGDPMLDFWDDFSADGRVDLRESESDSPIASLAVQRDLPASGSAEVTFLIAWRFPNRYGWAVPPEQIAPEHWIGNYYCTRYRDAWDVIEKTAPKLPELRRKTAAFVSALLASPLPDEVKEAALFNASTLRTQTSFRTADGRFFGWEGCCDVKGCCHGSCTHVWNYEQATAFLYGDLAMSMREVEFAHATDDKGLMSFRVNLPLARAQTFGRPAADGQMGCIMKMYRDWQLSGDDSRLRQLWPHVRRAVEFCWLPGGWDGDQDGVMEGGQHNTMDVEYLGPNPQMGFWYLGALRAAEEMARYLGETDFAERCRRLFDQGSGWIDAHLFNGEYYEHEVRPVTDQSQVAPFFLVGMGSRDLSSPDYQLASGCLVDQLVGQYMAHVCGLGYLGSKDNVVKTLASIRKYNFRESLSGHFNPMRTFVIGGEPCLLMADYPKDRPEHPFPYFGEVMTGFEYTAAVGMLQEGMTDEGLECIRNVRARYDGRKRSPWNEAECGHHYARAMASWAAVLTLTGFHYSGVGKTMTFAPGNGEYFWSNGYAWGTCAMEPSGGARRVRLAVRGGELPLAKFRLTGAVEKSFAAGHIIRAGQQAEFVI